MALRVKTKYNETVISRNSLEHELLTLKKHLIQKDMQVIKMVKEHEQAIKEQEQYLTTEMEVKHKSEVDALKSEVSKKQKELEDAFNNKVFY